MNTITRADLMYRPGEPIDWEFERFWLAMSPQWPGASKETTRWYFEAGRVRIEDYLATANRIFDSWYLYLSDDYAT